MALLALLGFFLSMDITLTTLLIEPLKRDMGLTDVQIGLMQGTAFGLAFGLSSIPLGRIIDRGNRVHLLVMGLLGGVAAMTGTALATNFVTLILCRVVLGVVAALVIPAAASIVGDLFPPERRSVATSVFAVGQAAGQAFGILAGGLAFDALTSFLVANPGALSGLAPWRALYFGAALLGVPLFLSLLTLREPVRQEGHAGARKTATAVRELWAYRAFFLPLMGAMLFSQIAVQAAAVWATPVLIRNHHLTPGDFASWLSAITLVGGIAGALAAGQFGELGRRRGGRAGVMMPALIAALVMAPLSFFAMAPNVLGFAAMLALSIFAGAIIATIGIVAVTLNIPNEIRGMAIGVHVFVTAVFGAATAPTAIALVSGLLGGEEKLGEAIAVVSLPSALAAAGLFALSMRGSLVRPPVSPEESVS